MPFVQAQALEQRYSSDLGLVRLETDAAEATMVRKQAAQQQLQGKPCMHAHRRVAALPVHTRAHQQDL